jgi:RecA-family ATPase
MTDDPFDGLNPITGPETPPQNVTDMAEYKKRPRQAHARQVNSSDRKSRFFVAADLASKPVPPRDWLVPDLIPAGTVTLLAGDGGTGKSLIALQLAVACALGKPWLGRGVASGRALFISAEDDEEELHRRLSDVVQAEDMDLADLDQLTLRSLAGEDALLAALDVRTGILRASDLHRELDAFLTELRPVVLVLDTLADLFPGNENDRAQARQFVSLLRGLAMRHQCAVVLLSHPSLSGMQSGAGTSGSTGWSNSVRSRLYLRRVIQGEEEPNPDARILATMKANYGPTGQEIALTWREGVFVPDEAETGLDRMAKRSRADRVFLKLLRLFTEQGRRVNGGGGQTYAPTVFANHPEAEGLSKAVLRDAMERLLHTGQVVNVETGRDSKRRSHLEEVRP